MEEKSKKKISFKVFRIICLCLILVVVGAVVGTYFITKKSGNNCYEKYVSIAKQNSFLFNEKGDINFSYQGSVALSARLKKTYTQEELDYALAQTLVGNYDLQSQIEATNQLKLLDSQYLPLLKYSNAFICSYAKTFAESKKSGSRAQMNELYEAIKNLESKISAFEQDKIALEQVTNFNDSNFDATSQNIQLALKSHMASFVDLINEFLTVNRKYINIYFDAKKIKNNLNEDNAKLFMNIAVIYGTSYFLAANFNTISNKNDLLKDYTKDSLFELINQTYVNLDKEISVVSNKVLTFNYLYNRVSEINIEIENLQECALNVKNKSEDVLYEKNLKNAKQNVVSFVSGVNSVITVK